MHSIIPVAIMTSALLFLITESAYGAGERMITEKGLSHTKNKRALIFTAPPRNKAKDLETYTPIIEFLRKILDRQIEYRVPSGWGDYNKAMIADVPDIVFDGPHFNSWRMYYLNHSVIVRLPQSQVWNIIIPANSRIKKINQLQGKKACLQGATNFGKLNYMSYFPNALRLPIIEQIKSRHDGYNEVVTGKCAATIVTSTELLKYNKKYMSEHQSGSPPVRILKQLNPSPNQAISLSRRISARDQQRIKNALLSSEGQEALAKLSDRYAKNARLIEANEKDYENIHEILVGSYPFDNPFDKSIKDAYVKR